MSFTGKEYVLDVGKGSVATLTLFLAFVSLPMVGMLPGAFSPLPAIFYTLKSGRLTGIAIVSVTTAVLAVMGDVASTALYLLQSGSLALLLSFFLSAGKGAGRSLAYAVAINLMLVVAFAAGYGALRGLDLDLQVQKGVQASIAQTASFYEKAGVKGEELQTLRQGMAQAGDVIGKVYPALLIISVAVIAGMNMLVLSRFSSRLNDLRGIGPFREFRNPEPLVWVLIGSGFALLLDNPLVDRIALNLLIVILFMYFLQGLAITSHLFHRFRVSLFLRVIFYLLLTVQPYFAVGVAVVGIFDIWGNFRTPKTT
ncbi:YybS family protein [Geobacter sp. DSM 9736]|uniref:YybS family protein n=1 Tax=Geobacter sp. DSM 9736 TaxID=1277350 RepID=UPI000B4FF225|nr:YybS family protein [Geobacter sp. DSM 9736]SNB48056.1 Uncharacterized conserved protein YybS, DUF2232 family [Geobacter sp. DSM 9736]